MRAAKTSAACSLTSSSANGTGDGRRGPSGASEALGAKIEARQPGDLHIDRMAREVLHSPIMNDPIPAIREDDATGEIAVLFADLRTTLEVPFVNLIWRHLATMPGMLAWTWSLVKPMHATPALREAAETLRAGVTIPAGSEQPVEVFDAVGVMPDDRAVIRAMMRNYGTGNSLNLLSLLLVQAVLAGEVPGGRVVEDSGSREPTGTVLRPLPRLLGLDELSPSLRKLVLDMDQFGRLTPTDAVASLYRHLAHWPGFLAVAHAALSGAHRDGSLRAAHQRTLSHATTLVHSQLLPLARIPPPPPATGRAEAQAGIEIFTGQMIARMVAMGEIMLALLPPGPS